MNGQINKLMSLWVMNGFKVRVKTCRVGGKGVVCVTLSLIESPVCLYFYNWSWQV